MRFEGEFTVPGAAADVLAAFADVERMVPCMPGASVDGRDAEGNWLGSMVVAFGPKKIRFKGKIRNAVDLPARRGTLDVRGAADMRMAAPAEVHVQYAVAPDAAGGSRVTLVSDAELGGVLADFARTGGVAVTQALMEMFAKKLAEQFSSAAPEVVPAAAAVVPSDPAPAALSAGQLLWLVIKGFFTRTKRRQA
ncbi:hypothetical protein HHL11_27700 [Ramlibacter sp. G-1-2-2]|uniref:Carbon monoxide dehydrogenase n=1 Tax=Ramlibacter agri TaxID=2728837 RepID=A0A848H9V9_9BURK|nr:SRPBCC domain-containing protein [Ramlibacter agri]NML47565.1 hypothetical protein [Ramlibacter agri]